MIERDVVLQGRESGEETMDFPITKLSNIDGTAEVKERPEAEDFLPIVDSADGGQMKKAPLGAVMGGGFDPSKFKMLAIKVSGTFTVPANAKDNKFTVFCQGGGGGGGNSTTAGGGGGGYTEIAELTLEPGAVIPVVIGAGGAVISDGGTSKFGTHLTAAGGGGASGSNGGDGGSGGGGGGGTGGKGGNGGTYGGGGGSYSHLAGGNGGTYGGGGGSKVANNSGKGGSYGGDGGSGDIDGRNSPGHPLLRDCNFLILSALGVSLSTCGRGGKSYSAKSGGGGGGYCGNGGNGSPDGSSGGGGGLFGNGGDGGSDNNFGDTYYKGAGGGGFNGKGGNGGRTSGGGGGGLDIGDGTRGASHEADFETGGYGYGGGGGYRGCGAPGIVLVFWTEV